MLDLAVALAEHAKTLVLLPVIAGVLALGATFLMAPVYTATTTFVPPQQQQSAAAAAIASLGALSSVVGGGNVRAPGDQYVALMQSALVADRLIERFQLMPVYAADFRSEARRELFKRTRIDLGKKDGLIRVEVDDTDAARAAALANAYVEELRRVTNDLVLTEAQQRRRFFEAQLAQTRTSLATAQEALQRSGFGAGAMRAEPRAAAEGYARLNAELTAAEVRLQTLRRGLAEATPEVQQQLATISALQAQLRRVESTRQVGSESDYIGSFREFKYQEALLELFSRQYELARIDESRDGALIQVVDVAAAPELKSRPKRKVIALGTAFGVALLIAIGVLLRHGWREAAARSPEAAARLAKLKVGWRSR